MKPSIVYIKQYLDLRNNIVHKRFISEYPEPEPIHCHYNKTIKIMEVDLDKLTVKELTNED